MSSAMAMLLHENLDGIVVLTLNRAAARNRAVQISLAPTAPNPSVAPSE